MLLAITLTLIIFLSYLLLLLFYFVGLLLLRGPEGSRAIPLDEVTVVIPFRNEAKHLPRIIEDLKAQDYPDHLYSVLLINDHSTDGSEKLVTSLTQGWAGVTCLDLPGGKQGKKEAVSLALSRVTSPWVLQTDADCRVGPGFISSHMSYLEAHPADLIAGLVTTSKRKGGFLEALERLDLLGLNGTSAGSFALGRPIMCSGANLLFCTQLFHETRRFDPVGKCESGDDMFLLIGARKLKKRLAFNPDRKAQVQTAPVDKTSDLLRQRIRWGAKSTHYRMADIQMVAVLVVVTNFLMLGVPVWMLFQPELWPWLLTGLGMKLLADFIILAATSFRTGQTRTLWWFFPVAVVYPLYMVLVIMGTLLSSPLWKGRPV